MFLSRNDNISILASAPQIMEGGAIADLLDHHCEDNIIMRMKIVEILCHCALSGCMNPESVVHLPKCPVYHEIRQHGIKLQQRQVEPIYPLNLIMPALGILETYNDNRKQNTR